MQFEALKANIIRLKKENKRIIATSSFQTQSIPLLHMLSEIDKTIPILYLYTGFLFPESLTFKDEVAETFGLTFIELRSSISLIQQKGTDGRFFYASDPDYCCYLNKVQPLEPWLKSSDIWINGIRADQTSTREQMNVFEDTPFGCQRFHPMLDWTNKDIYSYINDNKLPKHPLEEEGYVSIGCEPCTRKWSQLDERAGRWYGMAKTECGLHTELAKK